MATNPAVPFWDQGKTLTAHAGAAITGKRFVTVSAARTDGNPTVSHVASAADGKPLGVSGFDAAVGEKFTVYKGTQIMPVTSAVAATAGDPAYSAADGRATNVAPVAGALIAGWYVDDVAAGADAPIDLA